MISGLSWQTMPKCTVGPKLTINIGNQLQKNENIKSQRILSDTTSTLIGIQFPNRWHVSDRKWLHPTDRKWVAQIVRTTATKTHYAHVSRLWRVDDCRSELSNNAQMHCRTQINNRCQKSVAKKYNMKSQRILSDATCTLTDTQFPNRWHHIYPHGMEG